MAASSLVSQSPMSPAPTITASTAAEADGPGDGVDAAPDADGEASAEAVGEGSAAEANGDNAREEAVGGDGVEPTPLVVGFALTPPHPADDLRDPDEEHERRDERDDGECDLSATRRSAHLVDVRPPLPAIADTGAQPPGDAALAAIDGSLQVVVGGDGGALGIVQLRVPGREGGDLLEVQGERPPQAPLRAARAAIRSTSMVSASPTPSG